MSSIHFCVTNKESHYWNNAYNCTSLCSLAKKTGSNLVIQVIYARTYILYVYMACSGFSSTEKGQDNLEPQMLSTWHSLTLRVWFTSIFVPKNQTINSDNYITVLATFLKHLRAKRPSKLKNGWFFHQDNALPHISQVTMEFMAKKGTLLFEHAHYSSYLAPADFYLLPELKNKLGGQRFDTNYELIQAVQGYTREMSKDSFFFVMEK